MGPGASMNKLSGAGSGDEEKAGRRRARRRREWVRVGKAAEN